MNNTLKKIGTLTAFLTTLLCVKGFCASVDTNGFSVCIDPGHQGSWVDMSAPEELAPGAGMTKAKATSGTQGVSTGVPEYQLNLDISLALSQKLKDRGYRTVLTREDNNTAISNSERAMLASEEDCDVLVRIHANGSEDQGVSGALAMVMSPSNPYVGMLFDQSSRLAECILNRYCMETGFQNLGTLYEDEMTGINWSQVPVMILEMGYMTNPSEDAQMQDPAMQEKMVKGIADGLDDYFGISGKPSAKDTKEMENKENTENAENAEKAGQDQIAPQDLKKGISGLIAEKTKKEKESVEDENSVSSEEMYPEDLNLAVIRDWLMQGIYDQYLAGRESSGQIWAVSLEALDREKRASGKAGDSYISEYHADYVMQSASVIKVFIMGAVYDRILYPSDETKQIALQGTDFGGLQSLLNAMITVSDNDAANRLIEILGQGNFQAGAEVIREFCLENEYFHTSIGRRFLESNPTGDNYTSSSDCRKILSDIYYGACVCPEASEAMLGFLSGQTVRHKIPSGLPGGFSCANKTGEMPEGYGLGCIENDIAIVFGPECDYVLCVLSNNLGGDNGGAQQNISAISSYTASQIGILMQEKSSEEEEAGSGKEEAGGKKTGSGEMPDSEKTESMSGETETETGDDRENAHAVA